LLLHRDAWEADRLTGDAGFMSVLVRSLALFLVVAAVHCDENGLPLRHLPHLDTGDASSFGAGPARSDTDRACPARSEFLGTLRLLEDSGWFRLHVRQPPVVSHVADQICTASAGCRGTT
jgi:hypothetical protein